MINRYADTDSQVGRSAVAAWPATVILERYVCWREACADVQGAYDAWRGAPSAERTGAFLAYNAALDREESAARDYRDLTQQVELRRRELMRS